MISMHFLSTNFWLLPVAYPALGGAIYFHFRLKKSVSAGLIGARELRYFECGWFLAIASPCVILWILAISAGPASSPDPLTWRAPYMWMALATIVSSWVIFLVWIFLGRGAELLSRCVSLTWPRWHGFLTPFWMRVLSVILVGSGVWSMTERFLVAAQ